MNRPLTLALAAILLAGCSSGHSSGSLTSTAPGATTSTTAPVTSTAAPAATAPVTSRGATGRRCWPIVLVHGIGGWNSVLGFDYFQGVKPALRANGFEVTSVYVTSIATIERRGQDLAAAILAAYPDPRVKVNVIAHSMGGLDARYAITTLGLSHKVASLTTISSPHRGTVFADVTVGLLPVPWITKANSVLSVLGFDAQGAVELSTSYMAGFNARTPDDPRVAYFSWAGVADPKGKKTGAPLQALLYPSYFAIEALQGENDGLVPVSSARWGQFQGTIDADHGQEVGLFPGHLSAAFDHVKFYVDRAEELELRGLGP